MSTISLRWKLCFLVGLLIATCPYSLCAATLTLNGVKTEVYFSPKGGAEEAILRTINLAKREIYVLAYSFTSAPIHAALAKAHARGLKVLVILDKSQTNAKGGKFQSLLEAGVPVLIDNAHAIAHNKVMIIDKRKVITGSFNFTKSAEERNTENLLIIHSRSLSKKYLVDFDRHVEHGVVVAPQ